MKHEVQTKWTGQMSFDSVVDGHTITMDANPEVGGQDKGPTPKPMLLTSLSGCTGMDIASLLKKMRVGVDAITIDVTGELTDEHPKHYETIHIIYRFGGAELNRAKIEKAVTLSQDRYCGVSYMLGQVAKLTYEIVYEDELVNQSAITD
ncbi:MAG: OsmC family protein [Cyclobacteriaceae bacterium]